MQTYTESDRLSAYTASLQERDVETGYILDEWGRNYYVDGTPMSTFVDAMRKVVAHNMDSGGTTPSPSEDYIQSTDTKDGGGYQDYPGIVDEGEPTGTTSNGVRSAGESGELPDFDDIVNS